MHKVRFFVVHALGHKAGTDILKIFTDEQLTVASSLFDELSEQTGSMPSGAKYYNVHLYIVDDPEVLKRDS